VPENETIEPQRPTLTLNGAPKNAAEPQRPPVERVISAKQDPEPTGGVGTKVVALKLPQGIMIQGGYWTETEELSFAGPRKVRSYRKAGPKVYIQGNVDTYEFQLSGRLPDMGGYVLTYGVNAQVWDQWFEVNKPDERRDIEGHLLISSGLIAAFDSEAAAVTWCRGADRRDLRSGLERIDPNNLELTTGRRVPETQGQRVNQLGTISPVQRAAATQG
jgi:hypothetical protein